MAKVAQLKRSNSFCCCMGTQQVNKIQPLDTDHEHPRVVVDNFFHRGQGDGASDNEKPFKFERHISGTSFSTRTTIGDIESQAGLSEFDTSSGDESDSSCDSDEDNDEMKTVITEGGLSKVALDLDHPFAPYYEGLDEEDIPGLLLSDTRLRGAGFYVAERSTLNRGLDSQMSTYTDYDPAMLREDTPVPGKRPSNLIHHLAKRKTCPKLRRGTNTLGRHVPFSSELETMCETDRAATPAMSTNRTTGRGDISSRTTLSTARTLPAEEVDSLASSNSNLSAIGERTEASTSDFSSSFSTSSSEPQQTKQGAKSKQLSKSHNLSNNFLKNLLGENAQGIKFGSTFPMAMRHAQNENNKTESRKKDHSKVKPKIPPKPPRHKTAAAFAAIPDKPPQSADPFSNPRTSPRSIDILGPAPRTADIFSRKNAEKILSDQPYSYDNYGYGGLPHRNGAAQSSYISQSQHPFAMGGTESPNRLEQRGESGHNAWQTNKPDILSPRRRRIESANARTRHDRHINTTDVDCRPKAARPRRPVTAVDSPLPKRPPRKSDAKKRPTSQSEDSTDGLDDESHPEGPDFGKFTTIIVI